MLRIVLLLSSLVCSAVFADVFKRVDANGRVHFSDRPGPDAERIEVKPVQAVETPSPMGNVTESRQGEKADAFKYETFSIDSPADGEGVRANDGNITVRMTIRPSLQRGHSIAISIDGDRLATGTSTVFELKNLSRGTHSLEAAVVDDAGSEVSRTKPVSFHVLRVAGG